MTAGYMTCITALECHTWSANDSSGSVNTFMHFTPAEWLAVQLQNYYLRVER